MKRVAIVGFGRFGKTLKKLLENNFELLIINRNNPEDIKKTDVIFYSVPISSFESVIKSHKKFFKQNHLLIDVLSVKTHPKKVFEKYLQGLKTQALLTHPMFGPDSSRNGFFGLSLMINQFTADDKNYYFWKNYFSSKGLKIVEITPDEHDRLAAPSQGLTHFIGRVLEEYGFEKTSIDTLGAKKLHEVVDQTCNDNIRLFRDLQNFNPFTKKMRIKFGKAYDSIYEKLLPKRVSPNYLVLGIQGGKGSFNEEAANFIISKNRIRKFRIKYLYTTEKVLKNLREGSIDFGIFAIQNAVGGLVMESAYAIARYKFKIVDEFAIEIRHFLMKRKDADFSKITQIMSHPQVFKQCRFTLSKKYPGLKLISGKGDMIDTAKAARSLSIMRIPKTTAIIGSVRLAETFYFDVVDRDLQDSKNNLTTFFLVSR